MDVEEFVDVIYETLDEFDVPEDRIWIDIQGDSGFDIDVGDIYQSTHKVTVRFPFEYVNELDSNWFRESFWQDEIASVDENAVFWVYRTTTDERDIYIYIAFAE